MKTVVTKARPLVGQHGYHDAPLDLDNFMFAHEGQGRMHQSPGVEGGLR
jgi:hypothetical protein